MRARPRNLLDSVGWKSPDLGHSFNHEVEIEVERKELLLPGGFFPTSRLGHPAVLSLVLRYRWATWQNPSWSLKSFPPCTPTLYLVKRGVLQHRADSLSLMQH